MSFRITCLMIPYVLKEVMLCTRKRRVKSCVGGVHVFIMAYLAILMPNCLSGGHVLDCCMG